MYNPRIDNIVGCNSTDESLSVYCRFRSPLKGRPSQIVSRVLVCMAQRVHSQKSGSSLGSTGRMRFPNEESWVMKKPEEWTCACCSAAFCWAAMCCCSALSLTSFRLDGLDDRGMLAPGLFMEPPCISRLFSLSSSARMATRVLFWKPAPGGLAAMTSEQGAKQSQVHQAEGLKVFFFFLDSLVK